ncbi:hypothetical protein ACPPVS_09200 [Cellulomonas sp. McL0617]|uniref:hypothetical protein n=1 Tax=Cellulomonas sp. McL0617 TaxID=3415675 RepID=UPI003CE91B22
MTLAEDSAVTTPVRRRRVLVVGVLIVTAAVAAVGARAWLGSGLVLPAGDAVCIPRASDGPLVVGAALLTNDGRLPLRVESVAPARDGALEQGEGLWAKRLDRDGDVAVGASVSAAELAGYTRIDADGLLVAQGEQWSLVTTVESPPAGGRLDGFVTVWTRGPFEYHSRSGPTLTVVPAGDSCG